MNFASHGFLWLLLILALLPFRSWIFKGKQYPTLQFSRISDLKNLPISWMTWASRFCKTLLFLGLALAVVALARPQSTDTKMRKNVEGIDIMFAFDISDSMLIEDMAPENRIDAAKRTIKEFVLGRVSDRIGLVAFSGEAYTRVPLTLDYEMLVSNLEDLEPNRNLKMGTAIGVGLATAIARLKDSTAKSRVVIFLTDGENNTGTISPETALDIAKGYGVKIYSIGIGRDGQAQLPVISTDAFGRKFKRYQPIHSTINEELLQKFAQDTGGKFYRATKLASLREVFQEIDRLEKTKIDINQFSKRNELFENYLSKGLWLFLIGGISLRTVLRRRP